MELYPLLLADHPNWHGEHAYSLHVRGVLLRVLRALDRSRHHEQAFARAYTFVRPLLDAPMCLHQRLRLSYLTARARVARNEDRAALHWLNRTLDIESQLDDTADLAYLHFLRGGIYRRMLHFRLASHDHRRALHILSGDARRSNFHDTEFRLLILLQLVGFEFYQGHYWQAQLYLDDARHLLPFVPRRSTSVAYLTWMHSLLDRWAGSSWRALEEAHAAARVFVDLGDTTSADRIIYHSAECALDIAQQLDIQGSECDRKLAEAHGQLKASCKLATSDHDENGQVLASLGVIRWSRIARRNEDRLDRLDRILTRAYTLNDEILIAQTYTTFGDEFAFREERESSSACYRAALDALQGTDSPAAGVWAWRALHIPQEWLA